jgi:hypothetical protein
MAAAGALIGLPAIPLLLLAGPYRIGAVATCAGVVALGVFAAHLLWDDRSADALGMLLVAAAVAAAVLVLSFFAYYAITVSSSLCGYAGTAFEVVRWIVLASVYSTIGVWGFQRPRRLIWAWPLAIVAALGLLLAVTAAVPSAHGYCEA